MDHINEEIIEPLISNKPQRHNGSIMFNPNDKNILRQCQRLNGVAPMLSLGFYIAAHLTVVVQTNHLIIGLIFVCILVVSYYQTFIKFGYKVLNLLATIESNHQLFSTEEAKTYLLKLSEFDISKRSACLYLELLEHRPSDECTTVSPNKLCESNHNPYAAPVILSSAIFNSVLLDQYAKAKNMGMFASNVNIMLVLGFSVLDIMSITSLQTTFDSIAKILYLKARIESA